MSDRSTPLRSPRVPGPTTGLRLPASAAERAKAMRVRAEQARFEQPQPIQPIPPRTPRLVVMLAGAMRGRVAATLLGYRVSVTR